MWSSMRERDGLSLSLSLPIPSSLSPSLSLSPSEFADVLAVVLRLSHLIGERVSDRESERVLEWLESERLDTLTHCREVDDWRRVSEYLEREYLERVYLTVEKEEVFDYVESERETECVWERARAFSTHLKSLSLSHTRSLSPTLSLSSLQCEWKLHCARVLSREIDAIRAVRDAAMRQAIAISTANNSKYSVSEVLTRSESIAM